VLVPGALKRSGKNPLQRRHSDVQSFPQEPKMEILAEWRQYPLAALMTFEVIFTPMDDQNFSKNVRDLSLLG
jgi:hypothetical protein